MTVHRSPKVDQSDKLLGIELLRFASAVAVLVFHFQHFAYFGVVQLGFTPSLQPFYSQLKLLYSYGFYGVQVFWCISGFIFYWKYAKPIADKTVAGYVFFVLRLSRLYPLHLATLLLVALLQRFYFAQNGGYFVYEYNDSYHFALQLFLASNWGMQVGDSFNGPIWSISIEVLVYTLFFLSLRLLSASPKNLIGILLSAAVVVALKISSHPFFYCVMFFYAGCLTALVHGYTRERKLWGLITTGCAIAAAVASPLAMYFAPIRPLDFLIVISPALIYLCVIYIKPRGAGTVLISAAGNITYASYLLHVPIQITCCIFLTAFGVPVPWQSPVFFLSYLVGTLALSWACYAYFEMPMQSLVRMRLLSRESWGKKVSGQ